PATALILYTAFEQHTVSTATTRQQAQHLSNLITEKHQDLISRTQHLLVALGKMPLYKKADPECDLFLAELLKSHNYFANIGILNSKGLAFCSAVPISGPVDLSFRSYFQRAVATGQFSVGDYQI